MKLAKLLALASTSILASGLSFATVSVQPTIKLINDSTATNAPADQAATGTNQNNTQTATDSTDNSNSSAGNAGSTDLGSSESSQTPVKPN